MPIVITGGGASPYFRAIRSTSDVVKSLIVKMTSEFRIVAFSEFRK